MKIAVLTPRHSLPMIQEVLQKNGIQSQFGLVAYDSLRQLPAQYDGVKDKVQGILVTGKLPWRFLMAMRSDLELPITCITHSKLRSCLYLVRHLIDHPDIPLRETFCDFIHEIGDYAMYAEILPPGQMPYTISITSATEHFIEETASHVEGLYRQGKIKMIYLTITQLYICLSGRGIPCQHISIQPEDILQAAQESLRRANPEAAGSRTTAVILLEYGSSQEGETELEYREATLMKALVDYKRTLQNARSMSISRGPQMIEVNLTTSGRYQQVLELLQSLEKGMYRNAGVGLGPDPISARERGRQALSHARSFGAGSAFGRSQEELTGPLLDPKCVTLDGALLALSGDIAKRLNISPMNYIRLLILFHREEGAITSDRVAEFLNITPRSANRILAALLADGVLEELPRLDGQGPGRPTRRYTLTNRLRSV